MEKKYNTYGPQIETKIRFIGDEWLDEYDQERSLTYELNIKLIDINTCKTNGIISITRECVCYLEGDLHEFGCEHFGDIKLKLDENQIYNVDELEGLVFKKSLQHFKKYHVISDDEIGNHN